MKNLSILCCHYSNWLHFLPIGKTFQIFASPLSSFLFWSVKLNKKNRELKIRTFKRQIRLLFWFSETKNRTCSKKKFAPTICWSDNYRRKEIHSFSRIQDIVANFKWTNLYHNEQQYQQKGLYLNGHKEKEVETN